MKRAYQKNCKKICGQMIRIGILAGCVFLGGCGEKNGAPGAADSPAATSVLSSGVSDPENTATAEETVSYEYLGYEDGILKIRMTNNTDDEVIHGEYYELYQELGGRWCVAFYGGLPGDFAF